MTVKVAINGFGRVGRIFFRMAFDDPEIDLVAVNGRGKPEVAAHLLKYDSTFGTWNKTVSCDENHLIVDGRAIPLFRMEDPEGLPWKELNVDIVMESTGKFNDAEKASVHLRNGAKKVVLAAPGKNDDLTVCYGVNHTMFDPAKHNIISNASCTTNAMAGTLMILDECFGIEKGLICTVHSYTNDQVILDKNHKDLRRARAAACSIIPTTTGAAKSVGLILPQLKGKLNGNALRVPTPDVSIVDLTVEFSRDVTAEEINAALKEASEGKLQGILGYSELPLVSCDYVGMETAGTIDALSTMVVGNNLAKVVIWYDNEWSYTCRMKDMIKYIGERL